MGLNTAMISGIVKNINLVQKEENKSTIVNFSVFTDKGMGNKSVTSYSLKNSNNSNNSNNQNNSKKSNASNYVCCTIYNELADYFMENCKDNDFVQIIGKLKIVSYKEKKQMRVVVKTLEILDVPQNLKQKGE